MSLRERLIAKEMKTAIDAATIIDLRDALAALTQPQKARLMTLIRDGMNAEVGNIIRASLEGHLLPNVLDSVDTKLLSNRFTVDEVQELLSEANVRLSPRPGNGRGAPPPRP